MPPLVLMALRAERTLPPDCPLSVASHSSALLKPSTFLRIAWASVWERMAI